MDFGDFFARMQEQFPQEDSEPETVWVCDLTEREVKEFRILDAELTTLVNKQKILKQERDEITCKARLFWGIICKAHKVEMDRLTLKPTGDKVSIHRVVT